MYYKKAFAFSITLWIIASLLFATVVILRFAKDEVGLSQGLNNKLQTQMIAESVLESLKFYVPTADYTMTSLKNTLLDGTKYPLPHEIILDGREYNITKEIIISLKDTSGMLNILYSSSKMVSHSLVSPNNEELLSLLADSLGDWIDEDDLKKINGAETNTYIRLGKNMMVRNSKSIQDIYELKLIKGFEQVAITKIKSNIYYGRSSSLNLMLIDNKYYLSALLGIDTKRISNLFELRTDTPKKYIKNIMRLENYNDDYMGFTLSKQFIIKIKVQRLEAKTCINAILSFKKLRDRPYLIISYSLY